MKISIRIANVNDLKQISELLIELLETIEVTGGLNTKNIFENLQILMNDKDHYLLVAENQNQIIGFINFCTRRTCLHKAPSALIDELVVSKNYRNKGIGKKLLLAAVEKCKELRCCEIEVSTEKTNTQARKFYSQCGFEEIGVFFEKEIL